MASSPPNLPSDIDLGRVFRSRHLEGLHGLRPIAQTRSYTCGPAAVATALRYLGLEANELQCAQAMKTNRAIGTTPENIIIYCRTRGLKCTASTDTPLDVVLNRARQGQVTLVDWNDYGGHWVILAGYEPRMGALVLADPARPRSCFAAHSIERFEKHWHADTFGRGDLRGERYRQLAVMIEPYTSRVRTNQNKGMRPRGKRLDITARVYPYKKMHTKYGQPS